MAKTYNNLWNKVIDWENLYLAYTAARKGKRYQSDVLKFSSNLEENLIDIQNRLVWKMWKPGRWKEFQVYDPKWRLIQAPQFNDRVVHHALGRVIEPLFERKFIFDSYACRTNKGIHRAVLRLQSFMRKAEKKYARRYVLKADISKYFASIDHEALFIILCRTIRDKNVLWLCDQIIKHNGFERVGIPVGALTSQLFANVYLDMLDHYIKDDLGIKYYVRYMDDFIILGDGKNCLREIFSLAEKFLNHKLHLRLNPKATIFPASHGVDFAGYRTWVTHILPRKRNITRTKLKFRKLARLYAKRQATLKDIRPSVMSFLGYMKHCDGYHTTACILNNFVLKKKS